jgi:hypothetical protein
MVRPGYAMPTKAMLLAQATRRVPRIEKVYDHADLLCALAGLLKSKPHAA